VTATSKGRPMKTIDTVFSGISDTPVVSPEAANAYAFAANTLLAKVVDFLESHHDFPKMTGGISRELLCLRHRQHLKIMINMLKINDPYLVVWTTLRQYETCLVQGLSVGFFRGEIEAWRSAIQGSLDHPGHREELLAFYDRLAESRELILESAATREELPFPGRENFEEQQQLFLVILLMGDYQECLNFSGKVIHSGDDLKLFNLKVIWPVLYRMGLLWQSGQISIADEHLVTNLVKRIATVQHSRFATLNVTLGKVVVSSAANEYHEVGAQMVADFLGMEGWDVTYLGANVPSWILLETIRQNKPFMLALSVAIETNLVKVQQLIDAVREDPEIRDIKIMVGGNAFSRSPLVWKRIGADGFAADADSATKTAHDWWRALSRV
jgi:MerR family transcriptional regulator, light-induced transcriptional regulator